MNTTCDPTSTINASNQLTDTARTGEKLLNANIGNTATMNTTTPSKEAVICHVTLPMLFSTPSKHALNDHNTTARATIQIDSFSLTGGTGNAAVSYTHLRAHET